MSEKLYTLQEAQTILRDRLHDKLDEGDHCPTCMQWAKRYRRPLTSAMAYGLVLVAREQQRNSKDPYRHTFTQHGMDIKGEWLHVENFLKNYPSIPASLRGDFAKLRHWGLVEQAWGKRPDGSTRNGYYRVTDLGFAFVGGRVSVASHAVLYNGECQGLTGEPITIKQALGKEFDYDEIMHDMQLPEEPAPAAPPGQLFDTDELKVSPRRRLG